MLVVDHLSVTYRSGHRAVDDLSFAVADGEIAVLLGANGAGKTTTLNCFLDFVRPSSGVARVDEIVVAERPLVAKRELAYVPENVTLYGSLTARENVCHFAGLDRRTLTARDAAALLERTGLPPFAVDRPVRTCSKGMRQKVGIAIALARRVRNVLLDEPTSGLDPVAARELVGALDALRADGCAVLLTTHDLPRAHRSANHVHVMARGQLRATWSGADLAARDLEASYLDAVVA